MQRERWQLQHQEHPSIERIKSDTGTAPARGQEHRLPSGISNCIVGTLGFFRERMEYIRTPKIENVRLLDRVSSKKASVGSLYLTATHLIFVEHLSESRKETWILHSQICAVEKQATTATGCPLLIRCKNFQVIQFIISQERDCHDIYISLIRLSRPVKYEELYCFSFNPKQEKNERERGWNLTDLEAEYNRMGVPNSLWQVSHVNRDYGVCDTYPAELYVPKSASTPVIVGSSKFRSRGRFPVLCYFCQDNNGAICRSSQPLSGFSARCLEDEQMLQAIRMSNPGSDFLYVVDTRPKLNAMANRAAGKGYENEDNYSNIKFHFIGIENIHVMRNSLQKLLDVCELRSPAMSDFLWGLESSGWLKHIKAIMDAGIFIAKAVAEEAASVLVHCSDGWDRTAQVCSIAGLLLDPFYRTLKGFMVLIEKDWVSFGHKFNHRIQEKTNSLWPHLMKNQIDYKNPLYRKDHSQTQGVLRPHTTPSNFRFWRNMYNRFEKGMHPRQSVTEFLMAVKEETQQLEEELEVLEEKLARLDQSHLRDRREAIKLPHNLESTTDQCLTNTPQDYTDNGKPFTSCSSSQADENSETTILIHNMKHSDTDLSGNSDQESGVADLSCRSPSGGDFLSSEDSSKNLSEYPEEIAFAVA
ncbi:myotubularin-related protein 7b isoform X3 [Scyliorhinus canicula]|uniref:myotubularin-related protein 7b isoform X3 n=1 Tax=Scyliorhinus canicula TaxID=7830 RepID=UPI0018F48BEE|nr:myotubularin-related protein 7b isoform X3 [Scyliorhinus canicula]